MASRGTAAESGGVNQSPSLPVRAGASLRALLAGQRDRLAALSYMAWQRAKRLHPLTTYRIIALAIAILISASNLHRDSTVVSNAQLLLLAAVHVGLTLALAPRLERRSDVVNLVAIALDIVVCSGLMTLAHGWRGPLWLYSLSAVFWPAWRFSMRGALVSVTVFDALVLVMNGHRIDDAISDGFGGDVVARLLMIYLIAGAISLT